MKDQKKLNAGEVLGTVNAGNVRIISVYSLL